MAVYKVRSMSPLRGFQPPWQIRRLLEREDWEVVVKAREQEEVFWLLYRIQGNAIKDFFVIGLDTSELVLVHMEGRLDQLVAHAVAMRPEGLSGLFKDRDWDRWEELAAVDEKVAIHTRDGRNATLPDFWEVEQEGFQAGYNRVDGLYLGLLLPPAYRQGRGLYGQFLYALGGEYFRYQVGLEIFPFYWTRNRGWRRPRSNLVTVGGEVHDLTGTQDEWIISDEENSLSSLFFRRDFRDYYRRTGWSAYLAHDMGGILQLAGRFLQDDFESLVNSVNWSIFDKRWARDSFRPNPAVDEVQINSLRAELELDTRNSRIFPGRGWYARGLLEKAGGFLGGGRRFPALHPRRGALPDAGRGTALRPEGTRGHGQRRSALSVPLRSGRVFDPARVPVQGVHRGPHAAAQCRVLGGCEPVLERLLVSGRGESGGFLRHRLGLVFRRSPRSTRCGRIPLREGYQGQRRLGPGFRGLPSLLCQTGRLGGGRVERVLQDQQVVLRIGCPCRISD